MRFIGNYFGLLVFVFMRIFVYNDKDNLQQLFAIPEKRIDNKNYKIRTQYIVRKEVLIKKN